MNQTKEKTVLESLFNLAGKAMKVSAEFERLEKADKRIYELSRMLPVDKGYELIELYEQSLKDATKITAVANEVK